MMAKLVAQGAQECSEGGDFLADGCSHPDADQDRIRVVVAEELDRRTSPDTKRPGGEHADRASPHSIKIRGSGKKLFREAENLPRLSGLHCRFDRTCDSRQPVICGQQESVQSIAFEEGSKISLPRRSVRLHSQFILHESRESSNKLETLTVRGCGVTPEPLRSCPLASLRHEIENLSRPPAEPIRPGADPGRIFVHI
jgi:hypothetical protein